MESEVSETQLQIVYVLTNNSMPGLVKIGRTTDLKDRVASLNCSTAAPEPFEIAYAAVVDDADAVEKAVHAAFSMHRMPGREFFRIEAANAVAVIALAEKEQVFCSPETEQDRRRRPGPVSKDVALRDLLALIRREPVPSHDALAERWSKPKQTVSDWLREWRRIGVIPAPVKTGRCKSFVAG